MSATKKKPAVKLPGKKAWAVVVDNRREYYRLKKYAVELVRDLRQVGRPDRKIVALRIIEEKDLRTLLENKGK